MAKYYYNKYNTEVTYTGKADWSSTVTATGATHRNILDGTTRRLMGSSFSVSTPNASQSAIFTLNSTYYNDGSWATNNHYYKYGYTLYQVVDSGTYKYRNRSVITSYSRGTLVQSNIIAEDGTYPANGRQSSDGYWYVRGSLVTPGTPTSITVPTEIEGGTTITISWGTSTNSDSFRLERQLDGGAWAQIYNGANSSYLDTVPKGTLTVAYRVRGANGTAYSSYRTSSTVTVKNFPEMGIRVSGALKTSDAGWVRVGGQLREIDTIWVRINGSIKEVQ